MWETLWSIFSDAFLDSLKMLPFLFIAYLILEYIEHRSSTRLERFLGSSKLGALGGALLGVVPQCGFSVAASNLYAGRVISMGTLIAVYLSTSDEALPIMLSQPAAYPQMFLLLGIKIAIGILAGILIDGVIRFLQRAFHIDTKGSSKESIGAMCGSCHCDEHGIVLSALRHTLKIALYIFLFLFILNGCITWIGQENLSSFMLTGNIFQPLLAALIGFIPNCAASVLLTELYLAGSISFGSVVAGLCTSAGIGLAVLYGVNRNMRENLLITAILYVTGSLAGMVIQLFF